MVTPGAAAVVSWSARIHPLDSDRHAWAVKVTQLLDHATMDNQRIEAVELPPFPSRLRSTRKARDETVRRLYAEASG